MNHGTLNTHAHPGVSQAEANRIGRDILANQVKAKLASAVKLIEHVQSAIPEDAVVPAQRLAFRANGAGLVVGWDGTERRVHRHALSQLSERAGLPASFVNELATAPEAWRHELAAQVLNEHFHQPREVRQEDASKKRFLVRSINGEARGFLSDRYRRIDSRPTLDAFVEECQKVGAQPYEGVVTDTRVSLRAIIPTVYQPFEGEILCFGAEWGNSDFGAAKHWMRTFMLRLWCTNGATMEDVLSQVHTGARLSDDYTFSERTYELDTQAQVSALRDVVRGALGPAKIDTNLALLREAHAREVDANAFMHSVSNRLNKTEQKLVKDAFNSADVINLPPGKTAWRASNALSWIANGEGVDPERKLDLQRLAGEVLDGRRDKAVRDE